jgi:hypothetical protein
MNFPKLRKNAPFTCTCTWTRTAPWDWKQYLSPYHLNTHLSQYTETQKDTTKSTQTNNKNDIRLPSDKQEMFPALGYGSSNRTLLKCDSLRSSSWSPLHCAKYAPRVLHIHCTGSRYLLHPILQTAQLGNYFFGVGRRKFDAVEPPKFLLKFVRRHIVKLPTA